MNKTPVSQMQKMGTVHAAQQGYTLIELMVALSLGLLISAAAIQLFITSQTTFSLQQGGADVQDSSIFGLELMSRNARMANHGGGRPVINDFTPLGGIVFTADLSSAETITNAPTVNLQSVQLGGAAVPSALLTRGQGLDASTTANHWTGISNATVVGEGAAASAQLVIQYRAPQDMFDCEGQRARGPRMSNQTGDVWGAVFDADGEAVTDARMVDGDVVVERYFLRKDTTGVATGENADRALVLACDAGRYGVNNQKDVIAGTIPISGFGEAGQVLMSRVDHFDLRLGVQEAGGIRYYTVKQYLDNKPAAAASGAAVARPTVVSLQLAVLVRAQGKSTSATLDPNQIYTMLGQDVKITVPDSTGSTQSGYLRKVYETTVALRNGRGE
ncbi:MAG: PilW family protein [Moraxellaceae bacterium]